MDFSVDYTRMKFLVYQNNDLDEIEDEEYRRTYGFS